MFSAPKLNKEKIDTLQEISEETIDYDKKDQKISDDEYLLEFTYGDGHGNVIKLIRFLYSRGFLELKNSTYERLVYLCTIPDPTEENLTEFEKILEKATWHNLGLLRLLGDYICDRGPTSNLSASDYFMFIVFKWIIEKGISLPLPYGNHEEAFFKAWLQDERKSELEVVGRTYIALQNSIHCGVIKKEKVDALIDKYYYPNSKIIDTSYNEKEQTLTLFTHAPPNKIFEVITSLAKSFDVELKKSIEDHTGPELNNLIHQINEKFKRALITHRLHIKTREERQKNRDSLEHFLDLGGGVSASNPITYLFLNRDTSDEEHIPKILKDGTKLYFVHGHHTCKHPAGNIFCLDTNVGKGSLDQRDQDLWVSNVSDRKLMLEQENKENTLKNNLKILRTLNRFIYRNQYQVDSDVIGVLNKLVEKIENRDQALDSKEKKIIEECISRMDKSEKIELKSDIAEKWNEKEMQKREKIFNEMKVNALKGEQFSDEKYKHFTIAKRMLELDAPFDEFYKFIKRSFVTPSQLLYVLNFYGRVVLKTNDQDQELLRQYLNELTKYCPNTTSDLLELFIIFENFRKKSTPQPIRFVFREYIEDFAKKRNIEILMSASNTDKKHEEKIEEKPLLYQLLQNRNKKFIQNMMIKLEPMSSLSFYLIYFFIKEGYSAAIYDRTIAEHASNEGIVKLDEKARNEIYFQSKLHKLENLTEAQQDDLTIILNDVNEKELSDYDFFIASSFLVDIENNQFNVAAYKNFQDNRHLSEYYKNLVNRMLENDEKRPVSAGDLQDLLLDACQYIYYEVKQAYKNLENDSGTSFEYYKRLHKILVDTRVLKQEARKKEPNITVKHIASLRADIESLNTHKLYTSKSWGKKILGGLLIVLGLAIAVTSLFTLPLTNIGGLVGASVGFSIVETGTIMLGFATAGIGGYFFNRPNANRLIKAVDHLVTVAESVSKATDPQKLADDEKKFSDSTLSPNK